MRLFGHPVHPLLVHFPVAFWSLATVCDGASFLGIAPVWGYGWPLIALGLVMGLIAMIAGFLDLNALSGEAEAAGQKHMTAMGLAWTFYLAALITRRHAGQALAEPALLPVALSVAGFVLLLAGGWLGGQLVYRYGAGRIRG
jgi:uncharacterized membrane protein